MLKGLFSPFAVVFVRDAACQMGANAVEFIAETDSSPSQIKFRYGSDWEVWRVDV